MVMPDARSDLADDQHQHKGVRHLAETAAAGISNASVA
jgi:hypothetical protein